MIFQVCLCEEEGKEGECEEKEEQKWLKKEEESEGEMVERG